MEHQLRFTKFDNTPWGFRLTGGCDCSMPLTVVKVSQGGIAEHTGLREHDILTRINNIDTTQLTHDGAHEAILCAGNDFTVTILRYIEDFTEQPTIGPEPVTFSLSEPSSLTIDINQVPAYGTTDPVYKPFSNKAFEELTPLESPLILSPNFAGFKTIKQQEMKESKLSNEKSIQNTQNISIIQGNELNGHIDLKEIEKSAKEVSISQEISQNSEETTLSKVCTKKQEKVCEINNNLDAGKIIYKSEVKVTHISNMEDEKKELQESISTQKTEETKSIKTAVNNEVQINETKEIKTSNEMYDKSKEISLEDAKSKAIKAASVLSQQAKINGQTFESTKMGTIEAYETISQNMKHKCTEVPCNAVKYQTNSQTDVLLKTFFIHLTDVMVALTQMISQSDSSKCTGACAQHCICVPRKETVSNIATAETAVQNMMNVMKTQHEKTTITGEKRLTSVTETSENIVSERNNTEVLKEVIDNIQSATGVDVTVNGKDPLEWLADLDQGKSVVVCENVEDVKSIKSANVEIEEVQCNEIVESAQSTSVAIEEIKSNEIVESDATAIVAVENVESIKADNVEIVESKAISIETVSENTECMTETKVAESRTAVTQEVKQKILVGQEKEIIVFKEEPQKEEEEVSTEVPQTPNTDEYVFKLDIKIKGLRDSPIPEIPIDEKNEEQTIHEDLTIVKRKRPTFTIGDVTIERTVNQFDDVVVESNVAVEEQREIAMKNVIKGEVSSVEIKCDSKTMELRSNTSEDREDVTEVKISAETANSVDSNVDIIKSIEQSSREECATNSNTVESSLTNTGFTDEITLCTNKSSSAINSTVFSESKTSDMNVELNASSTAVSSITSSGKDVINDTLTTAYNNVSSSSFKKDEEAVHETVLTSIKEKTEMSEDITVSSEENVTFVEEAEVKTMGEAMKSFATLNNSQIRNVGDNADEEDIGKPGLSDEEISEIISKDTMKKEQHIIGLTKVIASHMNRPDDEINSMEIKDLVPQVGFLRDSEVFKALNEENLKIKADRIHEARKKFTTFLQRPNRPIPFCKREAERLAFKDPPYTVNIKRQDRKEAAEEPTTSILSEGLFLVPEVPILIPEPQPQYLEAPEYLPESSFPDLEDTGIPIPEKVKPETVLNEEDETILLEKDDEEIVEEHLPEEVIEENKEEECVEQKDTIVEEDETCDENLTMEEQLAKVQKQLIALSTLPATIQQTLDLVTKKITKIVTKSTTETVETSSKQECVSEEVSSETKTQEEETESDNRQEDETVVESSDSVVKEVESELTNGDIHDEESKDEAVEISESKTEEIPNEITETKKEETSCEVSKPKTEEKDIHKLRKDVIDELNEEHVMRQVKQRPGGRVGRPKPAFGPLTPQERPIVLPGGRKWRGPRDAFTDSFIAETLSGQAEVIMGKTLGNHVEYIYPPFDERESNCPLVPSVKSNRVNFMKYAKPPPTLDHLKNSSVYKLIHDEEQPLKGVLARPDIVLAESDYREKCRSVTPTSFNKDVTSETEVN